ncbi:hypothetical protein [Streptacidiphilus rugosus]|uniref:hypothetical protein n=1 Tax=Streptacidiphilus rugosus TaxID=405783 RepID=UPI00056C1C62|nr:hypothetical protein [Streptacidiphilus rugosus]
MNRTLTALATAGLLAFGLAACQPTTPGSDGTGSNPNVGITTKSVVTSGAGAAAPTTAAASPAGPLLKVSGNGIKNTKQFTTGDNWTINYTYDCSKIFGGNGNFQVYVDYPNGDIPVNELGAKGASSSTATGAGTHTLKVASECPWTVTVTNG